MIEIKIRNKAEMVKLAAKIASLAKKSDVIGLNGTLGAGKSFFAASFINSLLDQETKVTSPTFNLLYTYSTIKGEIYHFDLYRLKKEEELYNIGIEDALDNGISLIEWPILAKNLVTKNFLDIEITISGTESRIIKLNPDISWNNRLLNYEISKLA
jgi:tRNA threonylcarbamoyladenosine biosynthesis protein TsaE